MLGFMGFSGSLPLYVIHRYYIFVFIDRANKDACLLACFTVHRNSKFPKFKTPDVCYFQNSVLAIAQHRSILFW